MEKTIFIIPLIFFMTFGMFASAKPDFVDINIINPQKGDVKNSIKLPPHAKAIGLNVFHLGEAIEDGQKIDGYAIVHYDNKAKPVSTCGNGICEKGENAKKCVADCGGGGEDDPTDANCYAVLGKFAKWKTVEPYVFNPFNNEGLDPMNIFDNFESDVEKWELAAGQDIIGSAVFSSSTLEADMSGTDGLNEVYFGSIDEEDAIAITIVWGNFSGSKNSRVLVEWDMIFDEEDYDWGTGEYNKMDFESLATHELGHSLGLADLYDSPCSAQTMYGYATEGETKKRSLEAGDINGINSLY